jgi:hypothetical protein
VVDDEDIRHTMRIMRKMLWNSGYSILKGSSAVEALAIIPIQAWIWPPKTEPHPFSTFFLKEPGTPLGNLSLACLFQEFL